jgi:uncharacterized protein (DUF58 family)
MSKLEYGSVLAASLAFLMNRQRDAMGLIAFERTHRLPAAGERAPRAPARAAARARAAGAGAKSDVGRPLHQLAEALTKRSLVVLISDMLDDPAPVVKGLRST